MCTTPSESVVILEVSPTSPKASTVAVVHEPDSSVAYFRLECYIIVKNFLILRYYILLNLGIRFKSNVYNMFDYPIILI